MSARDKFVDWKDRTTALLERYDRYVLLIHTGGGTPPPPFNNGAGRLDDPLDSSLALLEMRLTEWLHAAEVRALTTMEHDTAPSKKQRVPRRAAKGARR
jgi:hypothetical protein